VTMLIIMMHFKVFDFDYVNYMEFIAFYRLLEFRFRIDNIYR